MLLITTGSTNKFLGLIYIRRASGIRSCYLLENLLKNLATNLQARRHMLARRNPACLQSENVEIKIRAGRMPAPRSLTRIWLFQCRWSMPDSSIILSFPCITLSCLIYKGSISSLTRQNDRRNSIKSCHTHWHRHLPWMEKSRLDISTKVPGIVAIEP